MIRGECDFRWKADVLTLKWKDKPNVWIISTIHYSNVAVTDKLNKKTGQKIHKSECIVIQQIYERSGLCWSVFVILFIFAKINQMYKKKFSCFLYTMFFSTLILYIINSIQIWIHPFINIYKLLQKNWFLQEWFWI